MAGPLDQIIFPGAPGQPSADASGVAPAYDDRAPEPIQPQSKVMERDRPTPDAARAASVVEWHGRVTRAREYWEKNAFERMRLNMRMARGDQWGEAANPNRRGPQIPDMLNDDPGARYVANITLRHIQARTATIYGKNPKFVARRNKRLTATIWDGTIQSVNKAMQTLADAAQDPMNPDAQAAMVQAQALLQDAQQSMAQSKQMDRIAETLELLFEHEIAEQAVPFKVQMKATVRRALTTSVGYVKLGYQTVMGMRPEIESQLADMSERLATMERLSADIADGETPPDAPEADQLKSMMKDLKAQGQIVVREGLTFTFPNSTALIMDPQIQQLRGWVGAEWVAEEYVLTRDRIKEVYKVDVGQSASSRLYRDVSGRFVPDKDAASANGKEPDWDSKFCVWEIYNKADGLVYVVCDGYPDYLTEPAQPDVWLERFYPWFAFVTNEIYDEGSIFPPADVDLLRDPQLEINRARQGLREHRRAARPKTIVRAGILEDDDKSSLETSKAHAVVELKGLPNDMSVDEALMSFPGPEIRAELYETDTAYQDVLRIVGVQEANLGGTSGATATESSIAEGSRMSTVSSVIDDLDEFLTEIARAAGQVLFAKTSKQRVMEIVGPGAVWPELTRDQIAKEIYLDIEAASTGRPNKAQEIQNATQMMPLLLQIPGLSPEWLAREMLRRLDDRVDITDAFAAGMPSVQQLNRVTQQPGAQGPGSDPNAQGPQGANNAPSTQPAQVNTAPRPPEAAPPGAAGG